MILDSVGTLLDKQSRVSIWIRKSEFNTNRDEGFYKLPNVYGDVTPGLVTTGSRVFRYLLSYTLVALILVLCLEDGTKDGVLPYYPLLAVNA